MNRLFAGTPLRSEGQLTIVSLAVEAGVKRHLLTHKNTDLKDMFYARVKARGVEAAVVLKLRSQLAEKDAEVADLRAIIANFRKREETLVRELHLLAVENSRRTHGHPSGGRVRVVPDRAEMERDELP